MNDDLIKAAMKRDEQAYHDLSNLWCGKAYRVAKSICGSRGLAEDAVQEALIRFWKALPRLKDTSAAEGFFLRVVANESMRIQRKRSASPEEYLETLPETGADADLQGDERERFLELLRAVSRLPKGLRETVKLHYFGGFTLAETSKLLDVSLSAVKMRLCRSKTILRTMLEEPEQQPAGGYLNENHIVG